ncbi:MAG: bifunctional phosphopantothenoylcysteine decarboxylase/phosphopantothenate--cysteine ligase CoaBC [Aigarchaeota archaeon]|nr:bifunctional phosphopantothenoylcysteine decarboxylase/phosphopantothenate--cysteine ligase CoaBC [Aigarchaeota archaeon]MDW8092750.1 bifunctional phosphopantothenoylcysteine decarboxylase/phosphopantothenate--cysteine ligase CoaBC [Nitrososphaerota archaeon]
MRDHLKIRGSLGDELSGKRIALCVTGSISCYKAPDIARFLIRHGAEVIPLMSEEASKLLSPEVLYWATGVDPVVEITGELEHVELTKGEGRVDAVLIAPATESTISKVAKGISDNPVTLLVSCALGESIPVIVAPAMHDSMYSNALVKRSLNELRNEGVVVIPPLLEEGRAKLPPHEDILDFVLYAVTEKDLTGVNCLVTTGSTREHIDNVRFVSNPSSGKMGIYVAREIWTRGGTVRLIRGHVEVPVPRWIDQVIGLSAGDMLEACTRVLSDSEPDAFFSVAAVSDYTPKVRVRGKVDTIEHPSYTLELITTEKIVKRVRALKPSIDIVLFRAVTDWPVDPKREMERYRRDVDPLLTVINNVGRNDAGFGSELNESLIVSRSGKVINPGLIRKDKLAKIVVDSYLAERGR